MKNPLFKNTVTVSAIRGPKGNELLGGVKGADALRILHRDKAIKVVITEEFYLSLLTFWQSGSDATPARSSVADMKKAAREELRELMAMNDTDEAETRRKAR